MKMEPLCQCGLALRVPSGVTPIASLGVVLNASTIDWVRLPCWRRLTGMPPRLRNRLPIGKKNHVSFIRNPAFIPTEWMPNSPRIKSQLLVCGAMTMMHLSGIVRLTLKVHPAFFNIQPERFIECWSLYYFLDGMRSFMRLARFSTSARKYSLSSFSHCLKNARRALLYSLRLAKSFTFLPN